MSSIYCNACHTENHSNSAKCEQCKTTLSSQENINSIHDEWENDFNYIENAEMKGKIFKLENLEEIDKVELEIQTKNNDQIVQAIKEEPEFQIEPDVLVEEEKVQVDTKKHPYPCSECNKCVMNEKEDPASRKRRLAKERLKRWREKQRKDKESRFLQNVMNEQEDPASRTRRLTNARVKRWREKQRKESRFLQSVMNEKEDPASKKRRLTKERVKKWREKQSEESRAKIRALKNAASERKRIQRMSREQLAAHNTAHNASQQRYIDRLTPQQLKDFHKKNADFQLQYIERMLTEQLAAHHVAHNASQQLCMGRLTSEQLEELHTNQAACQRQEIEKCYLGN